MKKMFVHYPQEVYKKKGKNPEINRNDHEAEERGKNSDKRCKVLGKRGKESELMGKESDSANEPTKKKKQRARKRWKLLKNMLLAFGFKRHKSSNVSSKLTN